MAVELKYETYDDIVLRLHESIVRLKGRPVRISAIANRLNVMALDILTNDQYIADVNTDDLDISSPPLGYCNWSVANAGHEKFLPLYLVRSPLRAQKQGIFQNNVHVKQGMSDDREYGYKYYPGFQTGNFKPLGETILGDYPSLDKILEAGAGAFDRRFAIGNVNRILCVMYRGEAIGLYDHKNNSAVIQKKSCIAPIIDVLRTYMSVEAPVVREDQDDKHAE